MKAFFYITVSIVGTLLVGCHKDEVGKANLAEA